MVDLQSLMDDIGNWSDDAFGAVQRNPAIAYHLLKEVKELIEKLEGCEAGEISHTEVYEEFADCFMLILDSARKYGMSANVLCTAAMMKLEVNKGREWGELDANGVVEHIREPDNG